MFATRCKAIPGNLYRYCSFLCPSVSSFSRLFVRAFVVRSLVRSFVFSYVGSFARAFVVGIIGRRSFVCSLTCTLVPSFVRFRFCSFNYLFLSHSLICWSVRSFVHFSVLWNVENRNFQIQTEGGEMRVTKALNLSRNIDSLQDSGRCLAFFTSRDQHLLRVEEMQRADRLICLIQDKLRVC